MSRSELARYFEIQRTEHEAAKVIQKCWRRTRILLPWRRAVVCQKMALRIQTRIRGILARKWVAEWFYTRNNIVINWQAHSRRYVSNLHIRSILANEQLMAIKIQKIIRGKLARKRCYVLERNQAATRIQMLWRGLIGRLYTDKLWLQRTVIPLQNLYRKRLAQKRFSVIRKEQNQAALIIQKNFRNWSSSRKLGEALHAREMNYRMNNIKILTSEEELCQEYLVKGMERLVRHNLKEKAEEAAKALHNCGIDIYRQENELTELWRQTEILSARAKEQGFEEELMSNIAQSRFQLTELKMKYLFELSENVYKQDEMLEDQVREIEEWAANRNRVSLWRSQEYDERRHINYKRDIANRRREQRLAIADEKRRWQVLFYTKDGKPDKKRRPGRAWEASLFAGPDKAVYCGGNGVNLFANLQRKKQQNSSGSGGKSLKEDVDQTLQQVSLQTYLEEVNLYEQLLQPIATIMEKTMGVTASMPFGRNSNSSSNSIGSNHNSTNSDDGSSKIPAAELINSVNNNMYKAPTVGNYNNEDDNNSTGDNIDNILSFASSNVEEVSNLASNGWGGEGMKVASALQCIGAIPPAGVVREAAVHALQQQSKRYRDRLTQQRKLLENQQQLLAEKNQQQQQLAPLSRSGSSRGASKGRLTQNSGINTASSITKTSSLRSSLSLLSPIVDNNEDNESNIVGVQLDVNRSVIINSNILTPQEQLNAVKLKKKNARKSYLPALEVHANTLQQYIYPVSTTTTTAAALLQMTINKDRKYKNNISKPNRDNLVIPNNSRSTNTTTAVLSHSAGSNTRIRLAPVLATSVTANAAVDHGITKLLLPQQRDTEQFTQQDLFLSKIRQQSAVPMTANENHVVKGITTTTSEAQRILFNAGDDGDDDEEQQLYWEDVHRAAKEEAAAHKAAIVERRRARQAAKRRPVVIPWELLDRLDGEQTRFDNEKSYIGFNKKY